MQVYMNAPMLQAPRTLSTPLATTTAMGRVVLPQSQYSTSAAKVMTANVPVAMSLQQPVMTAAPMAVKSNKRTPLLDEAFDDEDAFIRFTMNAAASKATDEYRELYHFLLQTFTEADSDFDGLVGPDRFDFMIERAASLPRRFGFAPTEAESYPTPQARQQTRAWEFKKINISGTGLIAFDEWLEWAYRHICEKAATLNAQKDGCSWNDSPQRFKQWVVAACRSTRSKEYKELYHFMQECFTTADRDMDGKVSHAEFDTMIEAAAAAPRKFGFAPQSSEMFRTDAERVASRQREFSEMDVHRHGTISFDDWMQWCYRHICGKATAFDPTLTGLPPTGAPSSAIPLVTASPITRVATTSPVALPASTPVIASLPASTVVRQGQVVQYMRPQ